MPSTRTAAGRRLQEAGAGTLVGAEHLTRAHRGPATGPIGGPATEGERGSFPGPLPSRPRREHWRTPLMFLSVRAGMGAMIDAALVPRANDGAPRTVDMPSTAKDGGGYAACRLILAGQKRNTMKTMVRRYDHPSDYEKVGRFLIRTYDTTANHVNWLQPRWEYMHYLSHSPMEGFDYRVIGIRTGWSMLRSKRRVSSRRRGRAAPHRRHRLSARSGRLVHGLPVRYRPATIVARRAS